MKFYILITALLASFTTNMFGMESKVHASAAAEAKAGRAAESAQAPAAQPVSLHDAKVALDQKAQQAHQEELKKVRDEFIKGEQCYFGTSVPKSFKIAEAHFQVAAQQTIDRALQANSLNKLGNIYLIGDQQVPKDLAQAIKYFEKSLTAAHHIVPLMEVYALSNLGLCYQKSNAVVTAKGYFEKALAALKALPPHLKIHAQNLEAQALVHLGRIHADNKPVPNLAEAQSCFEQALKAQGMTAAQRLQAQHNLDHVSLKSGVYYYDRQEIVTAIHYLLLAGQSSTPSIREEATKSIATINAVHKQLCALRARHTAQAQAGAGAGSGSSAGSAASNGAKRNEHPAAAPDDDEEDADEPGSTKEPAAKRARKDGNRDVSEKEAKKD